MGRFKKERLVEEPPVYEIFKPMAVPKKDLEELDLSLDEYEAIRLHDFLGLNHQECADKMQISRPTFSRMVEIAHSKLAKFIIEGRLLNIGGGSVHFTKNRFKCQNCGTIFNSEMNSENVQCPNCSSNDLIDLAEKFGHGNCQKCGRKHKRRRLGRNGKKRV